MSIHTDVEIPEEVGNTAHAAAFMTSYLDSLTLVERLHRLLLDVIKDEFERVGVLEINAVQALLLFNVGDNEVTAGELKTRGYYQGSNVSYNLKKLVDMGFMHHNRSEIDRRTRQSHPKRARCPQGRLETLCNPCRRVDDQRRARSQRHRRYHHVAAPCRTVLDRTNPLHLLVPRLLQ
jgi:hypothetical protein